MKAKPSRKGFSLLELLAVITIMGILVAIVVPRIGGSTDVAKEKLSEQLRADLNSALERYYFDKGSFPADLDTLYTAGYYPDAIPDDPLTNVPFQLDGAKGRVKTK